MRRTLGAIAPLAIALALGCGAHGLGRTSATSAGSAGLRGAPSVASLTTARVGARLVPDAVDFERTFGVEPGGGLRGIAAGVRVVRSPSGALAASPDRLAQTPTSTVVLPERLGGGVLFALGDTLWRSDRWLAPASAIFRASGPIRSVWVGLDRVVLRVAQGSSLTLAAVDPRSGAPLDLGALPSSPWITGYAALDGFRAVALADLRGVVATTDAGATWRTLPLPMEPRELALLDGTITVQGTSARETLSFDVRPEGDFTRMATAAPRGKSAETALVPRVPESETSKTLGRRPLALAVTDGLPLADGSVVVAQSGALARVRLDDGAVVDFAPGAFPLHSARCHAIVVETGGGFVCAEPHGATHVYRYRDTGTLEAVLAFEGPRVILAGGSGALAVRGPCAEDASAASPVPGIRETEMTYCVRSARGELHEQRLTGVRDTARVVPLADGRLAVITPPSANEAALGQLAIVSEDGPPKSVSVVFDEMDPVVRAVLARGMWLDGFEERAPGVFGGWVDHAGTMLGVEIKSDGHARHGQFVRDPGLVVVGGRFGLAWLGSQHGFETIDGGLTWRNVDLPDRLERDRISVGPHGCSAIGCALAGWLRIGYGEATTSTTPAAHSTTVARATTLPPLELECQVASNGRPRGAPPRAAAGARDGGTAWRGSSEFTPFYGVAPPAKRTEEIETQFDIQELVDHQRNLGSLARVYVWGQKGLEFDASARWLVRFSAPFTSSSTVFSTPTAAPPRAVVEAARFAAGGPSRSMASVSFATSDDASSALLVGTRSSPSGMESFVTIVEAGRAPVEARRADGETWSPVTAATRLEGRWFVVTEPAPSEPAAAVLWELEAGVGHELARVPRVESSRSGGHVRLARRVGESILGVVIDGPPSEPGRGPRRWVLPIDVTSGRALDLEPLGGPDDGRALDVCNGDEGGFVLDAPLGLREIRVAVGGFRPTGLRSGYARVHYAHNRACVADLVASFDGESDVLDRAATVRPQDYPLSLTLVSTGVRRELRCRNAARTMMVEIVSATGSKRP